MTVLHLPTAAPEDGLPSITVADRAGITYRMLDFWIRTERVTCTDPTPGSGRQRQFSAAEAAHVYRMAELIRAGFRVDVAADIARQLADQETVRIGYGLVVTEAAS